MPDGWRPKVIPMDWVITDGAPAEPVATFDVTKLSYVQAFPTGLYDELMASVMAATLVGPPPTAEQQEQWRREREQAAADARAEWQALRDRLAGNAPALAVLDLHPPTDRGRYCAWSESDEWDTEWPCTTVEALRDAIG